MTEKSVEPALLAELLRGGFSESRHRGHAVIVDAGGNLRHRWGDPDIEIYPRSSAKLLQALPLLESGAADRAGLGDEEIALAAASHTGAAVHTEKVSAWLGSLGMSESDLRCGPQVPADPAARAALRERGEKPTQVHNNCSGKHAGFLTLARKLGGGPDYIDPDHPVQRRVLATFEEMTGETSPGYGIDGCSAPNFRCSLKGFALAMARLAAPEGLGEARGAAAKRLLDAIVAHPVMIAGEGKACTELIRAAEGRAVVKTGAEGVYAIVLPGRGIGAALKVEDGATRASEAAVAALLVRLGVLGRDHPVVLARAEAPDINRRGVVTGSLTAAEGLY